MFCANGATLPTRHGRHNPVDALTSACASKLQIHDLSSTQHAGRRRQILGDEQVIIVMAGRACRKLRTQIVHQFGEIARHDPSLMGPPEGYFGTDGIAEE